MGLLPVVRITSPAIPQQVPFITRTNHANPKVQKLNQSTPQTTVSWTSRITLLTRNGQLAEAAKEFSDMRLAGVEPNHISFITLLSGCGDFASGGEDLGDLLHGYACKLGLDRNHVDNAVKMIDGYMRSGQVDNAVKMFDKMPERGLISWTAMINGFVKKGFHEEALVWFREMQISGVKPDYVAIIAALNACTNLGALSFGLWVHRYVMSRISRTMSGLQKSWEQNRLSREADEASYCLATFWGLLVPPNTVDHIFCFLEKKGSSKQFLKNLWKLDSEEKNLMENYITMDYNHSFETISSGS